MLTEGAGGCGPEPARHKEVPTMIVRMWEADVKPGKMERFLDILQTTIVPRLAATEGFISAEIVTSMQDEQRVVVISRWRDEDAIAAYAGPLWRIRAPFVDFEVGDYLTRTSRVHHYRPVAVQQPVTSKARPADGVSQ
jgi:quinol monooxygenase YgiN